MTHQDLKEAAMKATEAHAAYKADNAFQNELAWHDAEARFRLVATRSRILSLIEENERLRATLKGCGWYWPEEDTSSDTCSDGPHDIVMDREPGDVIGVSRGGVVETRYYGWLPPLDDADSDDEFWVDEDSPVLAREKIDAEIARRAALKEKPHD